MKIGQTLNVVASGVGVGKSIFWSEGMRKAVYFESDWPESLGEKILVTYVKVDELESDAILRAMELYGTNNDYFGLEVQ